MIFSKYHGAGNDFILVNHWEEEILTDTSPAYIAALCHRRFGVGADGLMILERDAKYDFFMRYYNADGHPSSMCGNGGRCIVAYAHHLGLIGTETVFRAVDGPHAARITKPGWVELEMNIASTVKPCLEGYFLDTGSPHYVEWTDKLESIDMLQQGQRIRQHPNFAPGGTNANFVQGDLEGLSLATYERGVENETLACGTGVTAVALVAIANSGQTGTFDVPVKAKGGDLRVKAHYDGASFSEVWLCGPAQHVFAGKMKEMTPR